MPFSWQIVFPVFHCASPCGKIKRKDNREVLIMKYITEEELAAKLRAEYLKNPPMGLSRRDIELMSDDDILDTDYFMHECEDDDDEVGAEGFYIF